MTESGNTKRVLNQQKRLRPNMNRLKVPNMPQHWAEISQQLKRKAVTDNTIHVIEC